MSMPNFVYVQVRMKKKIEITLDYIHVHVRKHVQWWSFTEAHGKKKKTLLRDMLQI